MNQALLPTDMNVQNNIKSIVKNSNYFVILSAFMEMKCPQ